jgi:hypothetical protein
MKTYLIIKNDVVIAKRKAENCLDAMKKWCKTMPFGNYNPANFACLQQFDADSRGIIWAHYTGGYRVRVKQ